MSDNTVTPREHTIDQLMAMPSNIFPRSAYEMFDDETLRVAAEQILAKPTAMNTNTASTEDEINSVIEEYGTTVWGLGFLDKKITSELDSNFKAAIHRYAATMTREAQQKVIDDVYKLSPKAKFEDWKPQDALAFYERLKAYEAALASPDGEMKGKSE